MKSEAGSVLIEVVAFAAVGFGLVLSLGLELLQTEREHLELQNISRNAMRAYLKEPAGDIFQEVARYQSTSKVLSGEKLTVSLSCLPTDCKSAGSLLFLELSSGGNTVHSFGVSSG